MANIGVEQVHYFCPRNKSVCILTLYFIPNNGGEKYTSVDCVNEADCTGFSPNDKSMFKWEYCSAYREYNVV